MKGVVNKEAWYGAPLEKAPPLMCFGHDWDFDDLFKTILVSLNRAHGAHCSENNDHEVNFAKNKTK